MHVMLRFHTDDPDFVQELVTSWIENEGITISTAALTRSIDLTYVKEI